VHPAVRAKTSRVDRVKQGHMYASSRFQFERKCLKIHEMVLRDVNNRWKHEIYLNNTEQD